MGKIKTRSSHMDYSSHKYKTLNSLMFGIVNQTTCQKLQTSIPKDVFMHTLSHDI